ncbi:MAG: ABC transporter ATP-binding protein [Granulosicoccaceae bacterium]
MPDFAPRSDTLLVSMQAISKLYPGCLANDAVDLNLAAGEIHALLGENGAGKSTLVKILYGLLQRDSGHIEWQGEQVNIASPAIARDLGIAMVFQHFSLFDSLTVLENIALGMAVDASAALHLRIREVSERYGLPLDPDRSVYSLSVGERQRIEIVRCLLQDPRLLIMDEPTSVLTPQEVNQLFVTLKRLASEGVAILYISHKLEEIKALCDKATILRGGKRVASANPAVESARSLAALMMGDELSDVAPRVSSANNTTHMQLSRLNYPASDSTGISIQDVNLDLKQGELLGVAGVAGNGQDELLRLIAGEVMPVEPSSIVVNGLNVTTAGAGARRQHGLCCVPEERLGHAAVPSMSLTENVLLTAHHRMPMTSYGLVSQAAGRRFAATIIEQFNVQCSGPDAMASSLSGGNLQKFIVGREILQNPDVLVVSQPTWGVDAGAAAAIHKALRALAESGSAVLLISQDLDELMHLCDRISALCAGRLSDAYATNAVTVQQVGLLMGGATLEASA